MNRILSIICSVAIIFSLTSCDVQPSDGTGEASTDRSPNARIEQNSRAAVVDDLSGSVSAVVNMDDLDAFKGLALQRRDEIHTSTQSWTTLEFNEGQYVLIEEDSRVRISRLSDDLASVNVTLNVGKIWVWISQSIGNNESFDVNTPCCSLSVRGTLFSVSCDESGNTNIMVYEGVTSVIAGDEEFDLSAGSAADIIVENGIVIDVQISDSSLIPAQFNSGTPGNGGIFTMIEQQNGNTSGEYYENGDLHNTVTHFVDGGPFSYITISNVTNENVLTIREIIDAYNIAEADMRELFPPWSEEESNWNSQNVHFYACTAPVRLELIDGFLTGFACLSGTTQMEVVEESLRMGIPTEYGPYVPNNAVLVGSYIILNASGLYRIEPRSSVMGPQPFMVLVTGDSAPEPSISTGTLTL